MGNIFISVKVIELSVRCLNTLTGPEDRLSAGYHRPTSKMPSKWHFTGMPMMVPFTDVGPTLNVGLVDL